MRSIGIDLAPWVKKGLLQIHASRPTLHGLEQHLVAMHDTVREFEPRVVVVDPISNLTLDAGRVSVKPTLMRLIDFLKQQADHGAVHQPHDRRRGACAGGSEVGVSSLMDTWLLLRNVEHNGERNRTLYVLKSRGMAHSNQVREFVLSDPGSTWWMCISARRVYRLARVAQEARERSARRGIAGIDRNCAAGSKRKRSKRRSPAAGGGRSGSAERFAAEERLADASCRAQHGAAMSPRGQRSRRSER